MDGSDESTGSSPLALGRPTMAPRLLLTCAAVVVALVAPVVGQGKPVGRAACTPGVKTVNGATVRVFCGPAKAAVTVNGKKVTFVNGECERHPKYFLVNIGTVVLGLAKKPKLPYFAVLMGKHPASTASDPVVAKDGTYTKGLVTIVSPALKNDISAYNGATLKITLTNGRRKGTFSWSKPANTVFNTPAEHVSGSFTC